MPTLLMDEPKEKRKMFATFFKGHPVFEWEHWGYFNRMFGDCVESISMQVVVKPNEQSLFALIVFTSSAIVDLVLRGLKKAKFTIKGKHVWMRKFILKA
nr:Rho guanine nucleotide exchange factor [Ipomoea batatas]